MAGYDNIYHVFHVEVERCNGGASHDEQDWPMKQVHGVRDASRELP